MAEVRVSQAATLVEVDAQEVRVSQAATLVEVDAQFVRASQAALLVEIDQVQIRTSQVVLIVEIEDRRAWPGFEAPGTQGGRAGEGESGRAQPAARSAQTAGAPQPATGTPQAAGEAQPGRAGERESGTPQSTVRKPQSLPAPITARAAAAAGEAFAALAQAQARAQGSSLAAIAGGAAGAGMATSTVRAVSYYVGVCWSRNGTTFVDESARLMSARGSHSLTAPEQMLAGGRGAVGQCSITLANDDGRYSAQNSGSPLYANLAAGGAHMAQVRVSVTIDGDQRRVFTGVIREITETPATATSAATVTLECRTRDELLLQDKRSTTLTDFLADSVRYRTEDYYLVSLLELAGQVDGTHFVSPEYAEANSVAPTIDRGIFPLRYVWLDDESILDEAWSLAAACCGWFYCDADGKFRYHNITAVLPESLARQFGALTTIEVSAADVARLALRWPTSELYSEVAVEVAPRGAGEVGTIWEPDDPIVVQPGQTKTVWARLNSAQVVEPTLTWAAFTAGGAPIASGITVTPTNYAQRVKLVIENASANAAYFNTLYLSGQTLEGGRTVEVERVSTDAFWTGRTARRRSIRSNIYIQGEAQAETIAAYALRRQEKPVLTATLSGLDRHDVRLGWPVSIEYADSVVEPIVGIVSGVNWRADMAGFRQDVTVLETASLFAGVDPFFILGTNVIGDEDAEDEAYLFY